VRGKAGRGVAHSVGIVVVGRRARVVRRWNRPPCRPGRGGEADVANGGRSKRARRVVCRAVLCIVVPLRAMPCHAVPLCAAGGLASPPHPSSPPRGKPRSSHRPMTSGVANWRDYFDPRRRPSGRMLIARIPCDTCHR
jgi:hypothetical protein